MISEEKQDIFCSIDLELTGFDPEKEQIIEIGFILFSLKEKGFEIIEEWSKVFKPTIPVKPKIFGLTGIRQNELDEADSFSEWKDFIQEKIGNSILVGHSVAVDAKFLEAAGVVLSGKLLDTLELVQFILPTHHSYNLENLMHFFGVPHVQAHRALADAKANIIILEKLAKRFLSFPLETRNKIFKLVDDREFAWRPVLEINWESDSFVDSSQKPETLKEQAHEEIEILPKTVSVFPCERNLGEITARNFVQNQQESVLVVGDEMEVLELWKKGQGLGIFLPEHLFNPEMFESFLSQPNLTNDEVRFCLKVLVWQAVNWQTRTVLDLNLSFFGGQFRNKISGNIAQVFSEKHMICSYQFLINFSEKFDGRNKLLCIVNLDRFTMALEQAITVKAGWGYINQILKSVYNPETDFGDRTFKNQINNLLASVDLFFGLVLIAVKKSAPQNEFIDLQDISEYEKTRLTMAAENLQKKLLLLSNLSVSTKIKSFCEGLKNFFIEEDSVVKWFEVNENYCSLYQRPIEIKDVMKQITFQYKTLGFVSPLANKTLINFFLTRLGLEQQIEIREFGFKNENFNISILGSGSNEELLKTVEQKQLPAMILFEESSSVKKFYDANYESLSNEGRVFALGYSGGTNKLFRNFSIQNNSLMLATKKYIASQYPKRLNLSTLVVEVAKKNTKLSPYYAALQKFYQNLPASIGELLDLYEFYCLIFVAGPGLLRNIHFFSNSKDFEFEELVKSLKSF